MSNNYFRFKRFTINQDLCAMKVGTDGVLLGAWAPGAHSILDIGSGTGVVALMMAQRYDDSLVTAVEMDEEACVQAVENFTKSPFSDRLSLVRNTVQKMSQSDEYRHVFSAIVSNPPYFSNSLKNPDKKRSLARHDYSLTLEELFTAVDALLSHDGIFTIIMPFNYQHKMIDVARRHCLYEVETCAVSTRKNKPIRRYLTSFSRQPSVSVRYEKLTLQEEDNKRSQQYQNLMKDFYL